MIDLFAYQQEGVKFLQSRHRALLLDEPGVGKTVQTIRASDVLDIVKMDVVCPASVRTQWRRNYTADSRNPRDFSSCSYEFARDKGLTGGDVLAIDEIHYLKNVSSGRTTKILGNKKYGADGAISTYRYVWGLTGTPMPRDAGDLYSILHTVVPGALALSDGSTMTYWQYMRHFCVMMPGMGNELKSVGSKNLSELQDRMAPYVLRRTKAEALKDWKKPLITELWLEAGDTVAAMRKLEQSAEGAELVALFDKGGIEALEKFAMHVATLRRYMGLLKVGPVVKWLMDQFVSGMTKIVVMCYHREVIKALVETLAKHNIGSVFYWGGMSDARKDETVRQFTSDGSVRAFIGQIDACATGLDGLQHVTGTMVFIEFSWIDDQNKQAIGRIDRIGQKAPVLAQFIGIDGSIDGVIMRSARRRAADNHTLFN